MTSPQEESLQANNDSKNTIEAENAVSADAVDTNSFAETGQSSDNYVPTPPRKALFGWKVLSVLVVGVLALAYTFVDKTPPSSAADMVSQQALNNQFDKRLIACNEVLSAEPTDNFQTCLLAAKDGNSEAQKRIVWAYSRGDEHQDWQQVFNHLKDIRGRDRSTQLLLYVILHVMGDTPELRVEGEQGIQRLVNRNYAPAKVVLASIYALEQNKLAPKSNTLWLLERAYKQDPNAIDPSKLALIYANGLLGKPNLEKATKLLKTTAKDLFPVGTNNIAWFLATLDNNLFTENEYALSLATEVVNNPEYHNNHIYVDTLAASYAANNMFNEAIETQERAISLIGNTSWNEVAKAREIEDFTTRLNQYKVGKAIVQETVNVDKETFFKELKTVTIDYLFNGLYQSIAVPENLSNPQVSSGQ